MKTQKKPGLPWSVEEVLALHALMQPCWRPEGERRCREPFCRALPTRLHSSQATPAPWIVDGGPHRHEGPGFKWETPFDSSALRVSVRLFDRLVTTKIGKKIQRKEKFPC